MRHVHIRLLTGCASMDQRQFNGRHYHAFSSYSLTCVSDVSISEHIWAWCEATCTLWAVLSTDYRHKRTQQPTQECSQKRLPAKLSLVFDMQWIGVFDLDWIGDRCESWIHRKRLFPKLVVSSRFRSCLFSLFWQICRLWHAVLLTVTDEAWHPPQLSQKGFST